MATMSLWSLYLHPGKPHRLRLEEALVLTNVALTDQLQEAEGRTSVRITTLNRKDERENTFVLCSLTAGKIEQYSVHITIHPENTFLLEAYGPNAVYLSGNYVDEFANVRSIRDALKLTMMETMGENRSIDHQGSRPSHPDEASTLGVATCDSPPDSSADQTRKRRRTTDVEPSSVKAKGKEVDTGVSSIPVVQWTDFGPPGTGDRTVASGDFVALKYKLKTAKGQVVSDNIQGEFLRFRVGDISARVPHGFHVGLTGMKVGAQRIITVPLELAQHETNLSQFITPPQAYRIECIVAEFTRELPVTPAP